VAPGWTLRGGLSAAPQLPWLGRNETTEWALSLGLRRGIDAD